MGSTLRYFILLFFTSIMMACSGGNVLTDDETDNESTESSVVNLTLALINEDDEVILNVSSTNPEKVLATLTQSGLPSAGVKVTFALTDTVGELRTTSALTDENGIASVLLYAGEEDGAGSITASVNDVSTSLDFSASITAVDVTMGNTILVPTSISANGTASLTVSINEVIDGLTNPLFESVNVQFSSACVQAGTAEITSEVSTVNGVATATYKDKGCGTTDIINIVSTIGQTVLQDNIELIVAAAELQSIQFTEVSSNFMALKGTGGLGRNETATVTFTVFDKLNNPVANESVNFSLTTSVGGIEILPSTQAVTDAEGQVDVIVSSGTVATPVRVVASLDNDASISTISGALSISTGVADYNSFSLSASVLNPDTYNTDGIEVDITARLADHFNNPVPDGTTVQFSTEFGAIDSFCLTVTGTCKVIWRSQGARTPIPAYRSENHVANIIGATDCLDANGNITGLSAAKLPCFYDNKVTGNQHGGLGNIYGNRVSIFAYVLGEESFSDSNASGTYDTNEAFTDLTEAFRDENEDGVFGAKLSDGSPTLGASSTSDAICYDSDDSCFEIGGDNEEFIDLNSDNEFNKQNGLYNGVLCTQIDADNGVCSKELVSISKNITILQADGRSDRFRFGSIEVNESTHSTDRLIPANFNNPIDISTGDKTIGVYVSDIFNGLLPNGTTISFETNNGSIIGASECTIGDSSSFSIAYCAVSLTTDDTSSSGRLSYTISAPDRIGITTTITITD